MKQVPALGGVSESTQASVVSLFGKDLQDWTGGIDYLRLCITSMTAACPSLQLSLVLPQPTWARRVRRMAGPVVRAALQLARHQRVTSAKAHRTTIKDVQDALRADDANLQVVPYLDTRRELLRTLEILGSAALFPALHTLGPNFPFPWVGYIPDFQHRHLPQFFSRYECSRRDHIFGGLISDAAALCVNSRAVANDIFRFYPSAKCKIFALPFAPMPAPEWLHSGPTNVSERYELPRRFFLISNQFWIHKDHATAFQGLQELSSQSRFDDVELICTGSTYDHRWPRYFEDLKAKINQLGLDSRIRILGRIPKLDQIEIMKKATAVIQPTLFEGGPGGGSVYDAVAIGTRVIASNIPVNLEINNSTVSFFQAGNPSDLARGLREALQTEHERPSLCQLEEQAERSKQAFGAGILASIRHVTAEWQSPKLHQSASPERKNIRQNSFQV